MSISQRFKTAYSVFKNGIPAPANSIKDLLAADSAGSGFNPTYERAKNCSTVFSCVRLLSDAIASLPLKLYTESEDGKNKTLAKELSLYHVLSTAPTPWLDKSIYWKFNINCLLLRGIFASHITRNPKGECTGLIPINPMNINIEDIKLTKSGDLIFPISDGKGTVREYKHTDLFFCFYETLDGIKPVSPLQFSKQTLNLADSAEKYGVDTLKKGAVLPGYYSTDKTLSKEAYERLKKDLGENAIGDNSGRAPLLEESLKYNTVSMTAEDMQMLETRRYQKEEICGIFGVPPHLIGDVAQAKGWSTMEQTMTEFLQLSLVPLITRIENAITTRLIPERSQGQTFAKFAVDGLLRGDITARTNFYRAMGQSGALSPNEIRQKEELNPIPGGDKYYIPANMIETNKTEAKNGL